MHHSRECGYGLFSFAGGIKFGRCRKLGGTPVRLQGLAAGGGECGSCEAGGCAGARGGVLVSQVYHRPGILLVLDSLVFRDLQGCRACTHCRLTGVPGMWLYGVCADSCGGIKGWGRLHACQAGAYMLACPCVAARVSGLGIGSTLHGQQ